MSCLLVNQTYIRIHHLLCAVHMRGDTCNMLTQTQPSSLLCATVMHDNFMPGCHIKPSAQVVWPIVGQEIVNGATGAGDRRSQEDESTCTVMTVILKTIGRKYSAYMSKRAPRAAASSPRIRHACLDTADRLHNTSHAKCLNLHMHRQNVATEVLMCDVWQSSSFRLRPLNGLQYKQLLLLCHHKLC